MKADRRWSHFACGALGCLFLIGAVSCSKRGGPALYPVEGKVRVAGQPAAGAIVALHRQPPLPGVPTGAAQADDQGVFRPMTFAAADGLPEGEYRISVVWLQAAAAAAAPVQGFADDESKPEPVDRLQGRYRDPNTSNLRFTVKAGQNDPLALELK